YELEQAQPTATTHLTAGYLALCGARGRPNRPEDKASNVNWAIRLVCKYDIKKDAEWARLMSVVFAEARESRIPIDAADQVRLCDALASVEATAAAAADAYEELAAAALDKVRPEHAWLYGRAAQVHGAGTPRGLVLLKMTCQDAAPAAAFYAQRQWNFDDVVYTYLERLASFREKNPEAVP